MKSAVLHATKVLTIDNRDIPQPGIGEVLVKVMACGICGTDVHIFEGDKGSADNPLPIVLGHEYSGTVEAVGDGVTGVAKGTRVCIDPNVLCGHCYYCLSGIGHFCENMIGIGTTMDGGFSQYCVVPERAVYPIGEDTSFVEGAMAEPLACCLHGMDMCNVNTGDTVAIIGGGLIGLLMVQLAKIRGAARVVLLEPVAGKREMGQKLGADLCIDPIHDDIATELNEAGIFRLNTVIECVGKPTTIQQAIEIAGKKSVVMLFGLTKPEETITVLPFELFRKEIEIKSSFINPYTIGRAVALIDQKKIDVTSMLAECIPLERLEEVLSSEELRTRGKYVVELW